MQPPRTRRLRSLATAIMLAVGVLAPMTAGPALAAEGDISGRITFDGAPVDDFVCVQAFNSATGVRVSQTNADPSTGSYRLTVPAGSYRVRAVDECAENFFLHPFYARTWYTSDGEGATHFGAADAVTVDGSGPPPVGIDPIMVDIDMSGGATLEGEVVDESDNTKLPNICVRVFHATATSDLVPIAQELTDAEGFWGFPALPLTDLRVQFSDDRKVCDDDGATPNPDPDGEYATEWWRDQPTAGEADVVPLSDDLDLGPALLASTTGGGGVAGGAGTISGTVTEDDESQGEGTFFSKPAPGICVDAYTLSRVLVGSTITDSNGDYALELPGGQYRIQFFSCTTGFHVTNWWQDERTFDTANPVTVAGEAVIGVDEFMEDAGILSGTVTSENAEPLPNTAVEAYDAGTGTLILTGFTDGNGAYRLSLLPGEYRLRFVPQDDSIATRWYATATSFGAAEELLVDPDRETTGLNVTLKANSVPVAADDSASTPADTPVTLDGLLLNDSDADGDVLAITAVGEPTPHGTATLNDDGTVTYAPGNGRDETATFPYTIADPSGATASASVTVTIGEVVVDGEPPIARDDSVTTPVDTAVTITPTDNDGDPDGDAANLVVTDVSAPAHGTATLVDDRTVEYVPDDGFEGTDSLAYTVKDEQGLTDIAGITIFVGQGSSSEGAAGTQVEAGGTVSSGGAEANPENPIITSVTTPNAGSVTIEETTQDEAQSGTRTIAGVRVDISAPDASVDAPLRLLFRIDRSVLDGAHPERSYVVLRDRSFVNECPGSDVAMPDPCVAGRRMVGDDVLLTVLTSEASTWEFAIDEDPRLLRLSGQGRVETAADVSRWTYSADEVDTIVLARADRYPDALAGAPLAAHHGGPLLLTQSGQLDAATAAEIDRLGVSEVIILGGESAISATVESAVRTRPSVTSVRRIAGQDRFDTAARIADELGGYTEAYVVEGVDADPMRGWPDSLSVAPLAAFRGVPILLVGTDEVPEATSRAVAGLDRVTIVGGTAAVSAAVEQELDGVVGDVDRIAGTDRYETSYRVALEAVSHGMDPRSTWFSTGRDFPDALAAGPAVAHEGGVLLLVDGQDFDTNPRGRDWLTDRTDAMEVITLTGGTAAITASTYLAILDASDR